MRYELFMGGRYLRAKRREGFISLITLMSTLGVAIGVITLNIVLAVLTGLEEDLRDRILGFNPHVIVLSYTGKIAEYQPVLDRIDAFPEVAWAAPFVYGQVMLSTPSGMAGVLIRGILPEEKGAFNLESYLIEGRVEELAQRHAVSPGAGGRATVELPGIILGKELARQLQARIGDPVSVLSPLGTPTAVGLVPRVKRFVVVGRFDSGMSEYDSALAYVGLPDAQHFFGLENAVTGLEVRLTDLYQAGEVARRIAQRLGFPYRVRDWMEVNHNLFAALKLEKTVYFVVLLLIILVAAFNIVATLIMLVLEKRKDIAVLKSMGATRGAIARIFVFAGLTIGVIGTVVGSGVGYVACWLLARYEFIKLPKDVFFVSTLPVRMYPEYFVAVAVASMLLCLLATVYPARQAARLVPVDVMRYE